MDTTPYLPPDPSLPPTLNLDRCRKLIASARGAERMPHGELFKEISIQLKLLMDERNGFTDKITGAQGDAVRYQREAQTANAEVGVLQAQLIEARKKIEELTQPVVKEEAPAKTVRRRAGKVVEMRPPEHKAAQ